MKAEDERTKLFNEVWNEPMTTVAQRYGVSDNGLRKRCIKLEIPLPPVGYWAKVKAGVEVQPKPVLQPIIVKHAAIILKDIKQEKEMEFIDISSKSTEEMKALDGMDVLTVQSRQDFTKWCKKVQVPKKVDLYHPLISEYQKEIEYRKVRDKEHKFREQFRFSSVSFRSNVEYRENTLVLPIYVSDKQMHRAFRIVDTLIRSVEDLNGKVTVDRVHYRSPGEKDAAAISLFKNLFSFQIKETMVKRRALVSDEPKDNKIREFKPLYEKVFSGILEMEFKQLPGYWEKDKADKVFAFRDSSLMPLEDQVGEMIQSMFKMAQERRIAEILEEREAAIRAGERERQREIEEEKQKKLQEHNAIEKRKKQLTEGIEQQMEGWQKAQKLRQYADEVESHAGALDDKLTQRNLYRYVELVREKAEKIDPVANIIAEIQAVGLKPEA